MFPSTMWTLIQEAEEGGEAAFQAFVLRYRVPVEGYLARRGYST